jgi:hypothetical protein
MKITCVKKNIFYKGENKTTNSPITIGKSYDVLRRELQGPQGPDYERGDKEYYLYEIKNDDGKIMTLHEIFFDQSYTSECREKKLNQILNI